MRAAGGKDLGTPVDIRVPRAMVGSTCFGGVVLLALVAPFELTAPLSTALVVVMPLAGLVVTAGAATDVVKVASAPSVVPMLLMATNRK